MEKLSKTIGNTIRKPQEKLKSISNFLTKKDKNSFKKV